MHNACTFWKWLGCSMSSCSMRIMVERSTPKSRSLARRFVCVMMANSCSTVSSTTGVRVVCSRPMWLRMSISHDSRNLRCSCPNRTWFGWRLFGKHSRYIRAVARSFPSAVRNACGHFCVTKLIHPSPSTSMPKMIIFSTVPFWGNYRPLAVSLGIFEP